APTGTVQFKEGSTVLGTSTLNSSGVGTFATSSLSLGNHAIIAVYLGDSNFTSSTSAADDETGNADATQTALSANVNPSVFGRTITLTATVSAGSPGSGTPTGSVHFYDGSTDLGSRTLNSGGVATFQISALNVGAYTLTAHYCGDGNFNSSTSAGLTQTV